MEPCCPSQQKGRNTRMPKTTTRQDKTRQDTARHGKTRQHHHQTLKKQRQTHERRQGWKEEGTYLKIGGKNIQFKKALASVFLKKVQRKCPIMFFIQNVLFLEYILTH
jgi:hypothetical protein